MRQHCRVRPTHTCELSCVCVRCELCELCELCRSSRFWCIAFTAASKLAVTNSRALAEESMDVAAKRVAAHGCDRQAGVKTNDGSPTRSKQGLIADRDQNRTAVLTSARRARAMSAQDASRLQSGGRVLGRLLRTFAGASSAPNGPPRARAPSLSGRGPPRGRPSSPAKAHNVQTGVRAV